MANVNVEILTKPGEWLGNKFRKKGTVVEVDLHLFRETLKRHSERFKQTDKPADETILVEPTDEQKAKAADEASRNKTASELWDLDYPGRDDLVKGGLLTVADLREFIAREGDGWFNKVNGIGPSTAEKIVARLAEDEDEDGDKT